ncbi:MAG: hypothetical protein K2J58_06410 [Muribaculaceae bacterium]|nr:hypothetical protein [Muribaculaceae bacterium]
MKRTLTLILPYALFIIFALWMLPLKNGFMLRWYDEMSLFEPDAFRGFLLYPGGIFRYAGTFMTQFLYYPWLGATILIAIWLLDAFLAESAFRLHGVRRPLSFLIPFCLLASILHFDEAAISFESQGYVFYNTLGFTFSLAACWLFSKLEHHDTLRSILAIILPLLYPLAGFFALLPAIVCAIYLGIKAVCKRKLLTGAFATADFILAVAVPLIYYRYFPGTTVDNDYLYLKGLPELTMNDYDLYLWYPFMIASLLIIVFPFIIGFAKVSSSKVTALCSWSLFAVAILCCFKEDRKKTEQLRATVLMTQAIADHDWRKAVNIMSFTKESPNYSMCVLDNLARAYAGFERRSTAGMMPGGSDFRHDEDFTITAFVNVPVNHHIGRFNQSHRWATEHNVQYGNKVYFIKYTVLNALMNGDLVFAKKFNRLLERTMFHRSWAEDINRIIDNPSTINTLPDYDHLMYLRSEEIMRGE